MGAKIASISTKKKRKPKSRARRRVRLRHGHLIREHLPLCSQGEVAILAVTPILHPPCLHTPAV
jgi:hypothetical protein